MLHHLPDLKGKAAVCYRRKSHEQDESQVLSLETQKDKCEEIVERFALNQVQDFTEKKSAKAPDKRPFFKEMLKGIKRNQYSVIVCWRIDRLSRNMAEAGELVHLLQTGVIEAIITADKIYYPNDIGNFAYFPSSIELRSDESFSPTPALALPTGLPINFQHQS
ncbi:MAG: recombinase family protein [Bacteroidota bacterium]